MCACILNQFSHVHFSAALWTVARQAPLFIGFSRQEYWSGSLCPPPGNLPDLGIEPESLAFPAWADKFFSIEPPGKPIVSMLPTHSDTKWWEETVSLCPHV